MNTVLQQVKAKFNLKITKVIKIRVGTGLIYI